MTWQEHDPLPNVADSKPFYTYTATTPDNKEYYAAYIVETKQGKFKATVPSQVVAARGKEALPYQHTHYTHDTLQEAKDWCVVELVKRRLDT